MRYPAAILISLVATLLLPDAVRAERTAVLVTGESCPVTEVSGLDARKAYLGVAVSLDGRRLRPIRFEGDALLSQIFYQSVVNMSRKSYERRALSLTLKYGTPRAPRFEDIDKAVEAVRERDCGIVYLWKEDADRLNGLKTVRLLWRGE